MKFEEISAPLYSTRVKSRYNDVRLTEGDVITIKLTRTRGEFELYTNEKVFTVVPANSGDINSLTDILVTGRATLAQLSDVAQDGSAELQIVQFNGNQMEMGEVEIGIDERALSVLKTDSIDKAAGFLWKQSVLEHGGKRYFFILAGKSAVDTLNSADVKRVKSDETSQASNNDNTQTENNGSDEESDVQESLIGNRHFAIVGSDRVFSLSEKNKGNGQTFFLASRIHRIYNRNLNPDLRLACGDLKFVDWTAIGERASLAKFQLDRLVQNENSYLSKWDEYVNTEGDVFLELARKIDRIHFTLLEDNKDGAIKILCDDLNDEQKEALLQIDELEVVEDTEIPAYLDNPELSFPEFSRSSEDADYQQDNRKSNKILEFNENTGEMILKADIVPSGQWLIYPITGMLTQIERRKEARNRIQTGHSANPSLGLLIEENGQIPPTQAPPHIKPLTQFVNQKVFPKNPPTKIQRDAIEIALNTPDIALIQGPPGTGKTTVIAAIIERLNEESDKRSDLSLSSNSGRKKLNNGLNGRVLLTGFQHDAVENMTARMTINGLPVPKFGQRPGQDADAMSQFDQRLQDWCDDRVAELKKHVNIEESAKEQKFLESWIPYIKAPTLSLAIELLENAIKIPDLTLGEDLRKRLQKECALLKKERDYKQSENPFLTYVRGIRVTENGFSDDGPARAMDALSVLKDDLDKNEIELLDKAAHWSNKNETPPFLKELKALKEKLFIQYTPAPVFRKEKVRDSVYNLILETRDAIRRNGMETRDKKTAALAELLLEMENNPSGMLAAVKDYCYAFAATCQQSVNNNMKIIKGLYSNSGVTQLEYDFVIVDEAARVSPMDLMIPMVQGKRIILVGDHRQLPQLINDYVITRMEENKSSAAENVSDNANSNIPSENDWIKKSMFEYLFTKRIPELEKADGIQRRVTLDVQYRMHPLLGNFVSRNFYNADEQFLSGLSKDHFTYDLPGTDGKCAIWLDVPRGRMIYEGTSAKRPDEARVICDKLKEWIKYDNSKTSDQNKRLKFGVISFYKSQTDLISAYLGERYLKSDEVGKDRLRIGTVDSFQGMEFDVVFLSLVRTGTNSYGFLQLSNRLNVSMSRQKKLLVVVGDAAFYDTNNAKVKVPGLANFLKLCREKGKVL